MTDLGLIVLTNAALAAVLGLGVVAASALWRSPRVVHLLWLVVLARLLVPPVVELGLLPPIERGEGPTTSMRQESVAPAAGPQSVAQRAGAAIPDGHRQMKPPSPRTRPSLWLVTWLTGSLTLLAVFGVRSLRFRGVMRRSVTGERTLAARAEYLGKRLGLSRPVGVRLTSEALSPLVWPRAGGPVILLPRPLVERLSDEELDTVLAHELAHVRRRDHWVRRLEFAACVLYWWHPVVWWARKALRDAAEACCDEVVLEALPGSARHYAEGILKTLEHVRGGLRLPALASGMSRFSRLQERLTMIMNSDDTSRSSRPSRWLPITLAISALVVFPTFAERTPQSAEEADAAARQQTMVFERQAIDLKARQLELAERQLEAQVGLQVDYAKLEIERLETQAGELEAVGQAEEAEALRAEIRLMEDRLEGELAQVRFERERQARVQRAELELRRAALEIETLRAEGRLEEAEVLEEETVARRMALETERIDTLAEEMALRQQLVASRLEAMAAERQRLGAAGKSAQAEQLAQEMARAKLEAEQMQVEQDYRRRQQEMELQYLQMQRDSEEAAAAFEAQVAAEQRELEARMRELNASMEELNRQVESDSGRLRQAESDTVRLEVESRIHSLREMADYLGDDGEMTALIDELEAAALARVGEGDS